MNAKAATDDADKLVQLDPTVILADPADNIRYSILQADVDALKEDIKTLGGVQTPVEVEVLIPKQNGFTHRLTVGFRRHQAVTELNEVEKAGLLLPAIVRPAGDRLHKQISENLQRKNLSPMDLAVAIKRAFDAGLTRVQVRELFPRPTGKKGAVVPASNAWVNMTLSFLDLPKAIQSKIADGSVGVKAAYELTKVTPEKRAAVLERAEKDMENERKKEETDEKKYLAAEGKVEEATKKAEETVVKLDEARAEVELAEKALEVAQRHAADLYVKSKTTKDKEAKKKADELFRGAETDAKGLERKLGSAKKELDKLTNTGKKAQEAATTAREKLEAARKAAAEKKPGKAKGISDTDVKKAAQKEGASTGHVPLNAADMRKTIADLALPGTYPKVAAIGAAIKECFDGISTPGQMLKKLAAITGEGKKK